MSVVPDPAQNLELAGAIAVLVAILCVIYWRIALLLLAIVFIALTVFSVLLIIYGFHRVGA
jgi:hypothetical protein